MGKFVCNSEEDTDVHRGSACEEIGFVILYLLLMCKCQVALQSFCLRGDLVELYQSLYMGGSGVSNCDCLNSSPVVLQM